MENNTIKFIKDANQFLYDRGYCHDNSYFIISFKENNVIYFYPEKIICCKHPNKKFGKIINKKIVLENFNNYKKWMIELLLPLIEKYNININNIR